MTLSFSTYASGSFLESDKAELSFIAAGYDDQKHFKAVIDYKINKGWKIYWRESGDNGYPQTIDFSASENVENVEIIWPHPTRFIDKITDDYSSESYGYKDQALFPILITPKRINEDLDLDLTVNYAICKEVCIPAVAKIKQKIDAGFRSEMGEKNFENAMQKVPHENGSGDVAIGDVYKSEDGLLRVEVSAKESDLKTADIFIEASGEFAFYEPVFSGNGNFGAFVVSTVALGEATEFTKNLRITLVARDKSVEKNIALSDIIMVKAGEIILTKKADSSEYAFAIILLFGFLGGLILNVMPCVLPVLSIKLLSIIKHSDSTRRQISVSFLASAAGIIFSFFVLSIIVWAFKTFGMAVGWGFHFQEPIFLVLLIAILLAFAANMFGLYEFRLPAFLGNMKAGESKSPLVKSFMSGVLATTLATPCTAPFLGTAVGVAVTRGGLEIIYTFLVMGLGMSMPYLLLAVFPAWVLKMPKAGNWMIILKKILGLMLVATAAWLIWVVSGQFNGKSPENNVLWKKFQEETIVQHISEGKIVFVDVTADWCLTCKVNKFFVLDDSDVKRALSQENVVAMRADWTNKNAEIAAFLSSHSRVGIPFNIVYSAENPQGIILSELLSESEVLQSLQGYEGD